MSPEPTDDKLASGAVEIAVSASQALPKVQLDIDDAPFLREREQEKPPPPPVAGETDAPLEVPQPPAEDDKAAGKKKKRIILICLAGLILLLAGGGGTLWWFFLRAASPLPPEPQVVVVPSTPQDGTPAEFLVSMAPFWLELTSNAPREKGKIFFLVCKFTAISKSETVIQEAQNKNIVIRDALYFYLKNKDYDFLTDPGNAQTIKNDLKSVINGYLAGNKVEEVLFERYLSN